MGSKIRKSKKTKNQTEPKQKKPYRTKKLNWKKNRTKQNLVGSVRFMSFENRTEPKCCKKRHHFIFSTKNGMSFWKFVCVLVDDVVQGLQSETLKLNIDPSFPYPLSDLFSFLTFAASPSLIPLSIYVRSWTLTFPHSLILSFLHPWSLCDFSLKP